MQTGATGINDAGQIVGSYYDTSHNIHGFLKSGGSFTRIDVPGATYTYSSGINNAGHIVGNYDDTPLSILLPEPSSLLLLGFGLLGLAAWRWKHAA